MTGHAGIVSYGAYVPYHRVRRSALAAALGVPSGRGTRAVASFDEDTTSMGVEAARVALADAPGGWRPDGLLFATTAPAYLDKTNATAVHAAVRLDRGVMAVDVVGSVRNGIATLRLAAEHAGRRLVVASDLRTGMPASVDEREGGDAAVAFAFAPAGTPDVIAEVIGASAATGEFQERSRLPGEPTSRLWEERFGEHAYAPLVEGAVADAFKAAGLVADAVDHLVVVGTHARAARAAVRQVGADPAVVVDDLTTTLGNTGAAHAGLVLASILDTAEPEQVIAVVSVADGVDVLLLRTTAALTAYQARQSRSLSTQVASGRDDLPYTTWLTWRGFLDRQPPRRPDPKRPASPPAHRGVEWKFGFVGSRCDACQAIHLPQQRVCVECQAVDQMSPIPMADAAGTVATYTIDRLTFSVHPPVVAAVIDFDGGGRFKCELTDVDPTTVAIGDRVEMTFRRLHTADGVHNYFWKARPPRVAEPADR